MSDCIIACAIIMSLCLAGLAETSKLQDETFNILFLMPYGLHSHRNTLLPIAGALADKGHQVTFLTGLPSTGRYPKVVEMTHGITLITDDHHRNFFALRNEAGLHLEVHAEEVSRIMKEFYSDPIVKELYARRSEFDVVIIDAFSNEFAYPFLHGKPFILSNAIGCNPITSAIMGNVLNPSVVAAITVEFYTPKSLLQRLTNIYELLLFSIQWRYLYVIPTVQKEISRQFPDLPALVDIEKNASLTFSQTHFTINLPIPLLPSQIEIGGHLCKEPDSSKMSKELTTWIDGAGEHGVIYFSLGMYQLPEFMPEEYTKVFLEAFSKIPQRIIWKYPAPLLLQNASSNIHLGEWFPQQDVLGHPNVRIFMTQGGRISSIEGLCQAKTMLFLPIIFDQIKIANHFESQGIGTTLIWEELTVDSVVAAIQELIENPRYSKNARMASRSLQDQLVNPLERAVWWTEYVARNQGAPLLRSPGAQLSWVEYLMLDILFLLHLVFFALWLIVKCCFGAIKKRLTKKVPSATQRKKNKKE